LVCTIAQKQLQSRSAAGSSTLTNHAEKDVAPRKQVLRPDAQRGGFKQLSPGMVYFSDLAYILVRRD